MKLGWWGWRRAKWHLAWTRRPSTAPISRRVWRMTESPNDFEETAGPYARLAEYWSDYAASFVPDYGRFLASASKRFETPIRSVLDVACGSGLLSGEIATHVDRVVGIDASEAMIGRAKWEHPQPKFRFEVADFRRLELDETFDAAVCGSDSLNYVTSREDLAEVFRSVARSLRPGGLFAFDVLNERSCRMMSNVAVEYTIGTSKFQQRYFYDPEKRTSVCFVTFADGTTEAHRRIPLEPSDITCAAHSAGLHVAESFSGAGLIGLGVFAMRTYWILRK